MPTAAGARALLSAHAPTRAWQRLPRVVALAVHANPAIAVPSALPHRRRGPRSFHTSSSVRSSRPEDPNAAHPPPPADSNDPNNSNKDNGAAAAENNSPPVEAPAQAEVEPAAPDADAKREKLKGAGYGSARARANRNNRVEEAPGLELPYWFAARQISLYERRPLGAPDALLPPLKEEDRRMMMSLMEDVVEKATLTEADVQTWKDKLLHFGRRLDLNDDALQLLRRQAQALGSGAFWQTLLYVHHPEADPDHIERLRQHHSDCHIQRALWWPIPENLMTADAQRWLSNIRFDAAPAGSGALHLSPLAKRPDPEYSVCMELLAAVQSQLTAPPAVSPGASRPESRRPPIVLSVLRGKGRRIADSVVNDIATDLKADVLHLNAHHIARIVGGHLGQNQYSARGTVSMLGYAAAEMNGRLALRPDPESEQVGGMVAVELPSRLRSFLSTGGGSASSTLSDGRWEDMKIGAAMEAFVAGVDFKRQHGSLAFNRENPVSLPPSLRSVRSVAEQSAARNLIIHVHDYVELSSLYPAIIHKLRAIADRMWMAGKRVVLVGSSSGDMNKSSQWRDQLADLGRDGAHIIPYHASSTKPNIRLEKLDAIEQNISNIEDMLRAKVGDQVPITFSKSLKTGASVPEEDHKLLLKTLSNQVYDVQWVYRLVSLMVGGRTGQCDEYDYACLNYSLKFMSDRNSHWATIDPAVRPPYFSPLSTPRSSTSGSSSSSSPDDPSFSNLSGAAASKEYNSDEKKLLSGLINANDIRTTFNDIIVPPETKESLIGLTTLSLVRPEAFAYGVLKTEHIPGCLLYGPPGTGKTLLAKAVAKESGASMLEVSAADINDKWVGQSEKNVQALFSLARKLAPCVIFLDEADALLAARRSGPARAAYRETITQFLREWDGLTTNGGAGPPLFIMVATNRPFDLDEAVLRRLPRKILVDLPLAPEREAILRVMLAEETLAAEVDLAALAVETELYSGSDLKNLCVSAAMEAVREEVRAKEVWQQGQGKGEGEKEEYQWPERRVLEKRHFDKGLREISASISGDMESLKAIRKFDEQYGDAGRKRKVKRGMGFEVVPDHGKGGTGEARVRQIGVVA
ncbi:hypothetical protein C8A00DRAFT_42129 [Chaetomidium leptoderma]|uniref:AAA+ ATPase domain-containing protein n=1 Tax=Chaetomidium leptoderma TaxID=669021 RepID=A0AAN6VPY5_9PEZI|nr:hypothetical protein C8A00DRAFT_42129 [Chaetomidium leptoderma]